MKTFALSCLITCMALSVATSATLKESDVPESARSVYAGPVKDGWKFKKAENNKAGNILVTLTTPTAKRKEFGKELFYVYNSEGNLIYRYWETKSRDLPKPIVNACENTETDRKIKAACATCPQAPGQLKKVKGYYIIEKDNQKYVRFNFVQHGQEKDYFLNFEGQHVPPPVEVYSKK